MIHGKMTRSEFTLELMQRVMRRIDIVTATDAAINEAIRAAADEIATEIRAYWASLELELRQAQGEKPN